VAWWDNILRELQNIADIFSGRGQDQDEIPEETDDEPGGFFGGGEPPDEPPGSAGFGDDYDEDGLLPYHAGDGPYPEDWGDAEIKFWDTQFDGHIFDNQNHYDHAQELFYDGYMAGDDEITHEDRIAAREDFLDWTYFDAIDWDAFEEYYRES